ncbi:hypothetical protein [Fibrella forsythiae]|uniref:Uncharacterized protein n=1 Tax=Fibrella forsythiae TaxID=2817061 RepID=A0ABS3JQ10_9BACT|nr:hypothetical protein [Fibrella forsythiae]MBO0952095.1 hypothetical protein [Fibrella forsythiae]
MTEHEMQNLKEHIRKKYDAYRLAKPGKYPALKFNSYPASYEHLRNSFKEEFDKLGNADMQEALAAIPSAKTWAKIFHDGYILRDEKILNTCYLYVWGTPRDTASGALEKTDVPTAMPEAQTSLGWTTRRSLLVAGLAIGIGGLIYVVSRQLTDELVISNPANGMVVPRLMVVEGKASNAEVVWPIVHPIRSRTHANPIDEYYVQDPIRVAKDGTWKGIVYIGGPNKTHVGIRYQLRVFINPAKPLLDEQLIYSWPRAERASSAVEIERGPQEILLPIP